jgi:hypothetical protein
MVLCIWVMGHTIEIPWWSSYEWDIGGQEPREPIKST